MITGVNNRRHVLVCRVVEGVKEKRELGGKRSPLPETLSFSSKAVLLIF
jgi:hypothetical protein